MDKRYPLIAAPALLGLLFIGHADSSFAVDLNYESLSSLEEPIAVEIGDTTFTLNGLVDAASSYADQADDDAFLSGNFQIKAETQLSNSWTLGATYFGAYTDKDGEADNYQDNAALFVGGVWGTLAVGNVTGLVREQTRRRRGTGNAALEFDDQIGGLDDTGLSYITRFGPAQLIAIADEEGNYEIGGSYQRPIGDKDYRFTLRLRDTELMTDDGSTLLESQSAGFVSELTYGSMVLDFTLGLEQLSTSLAEADRFYASLGTSRKWGAWTGSAEAHFGETEDQNESSWALGLRYDIARGLSLNLGINYRDAQVDLDGIALLDEDDTVGTASLRYSF